MTQTVAEYTVANPAGIEFGTIAMQAEIEETEDGWMASLHATDYSREIGTYPTQDTAAEAALAAAREDDPIGEVVPVEYIVQT